MVPLYVHEHHLARPGSRFLTPRAMIGILARFTPLAHTNATSSVKDLPDGRVSYRMSVPKSHEGCLFYFEWFGAEWRAFTNHWKLGPSDVEETTSPWHGEYKIRSRQLTTAIRDRSREDFAVFRRSRGYVHSASYGGVGVHVS